MAGERASESVGQPARRWVLASLVGGAVATWLVAALLLVAVVPDALADASPGAAPETAAAAVRAGATVGAAVGLALLAGALAAATRRAGLVTRVGLSAAGVVAVVQGLMLLSGGVAFLAHGAGMRAAAAAMVAGAVVDVAVGLLAGAVGVSRLLPGVSLGETMMRREAMPAVAADRNRVLALTGAVLVGWVALTVAALATAPPAGPSITPPPPLIGVLQVSQLLAMPLLVGAAVAGWRRASPNRLLTLGLAAGAGLAVGWLFFLTLLLWELLGRAESGATPAHLDLDVPVWVGVLDAVLGAAGTGLWGSLASPARRKRDDDGEGDAGPDREFGHDGVGTVPGGPRARRRR